MTDVVIQIVNYRTKEYLPECIGGLLVDCETSGLSCVVRVLDNASGDNLQDLKDRFAGRSVSFFDSEKNCGFGAGHNFLAQQGAGRYILIVNPDVRIIEQNTVAQLCADMHDSTICAVGPQLRTSRGGIQRWDHGELDGFFAKIALACGINTWKEHKAPVSAAWVSGAFFLMRSDVFIALGGFDENFFLYKEEEDLFLRARRAGHRVVYDPRITVAHVGSVVASKKTFFKKSDIYFLKKHFASKGFLAYMILRCFRAVARLFVVY